DDTRERKNRRSSPGARSELCPKSLLGRSGQIAYLVQVSHIDRNRNVGRVAVIQEVLQADLHRNRRDHLAKTRHLQKFHTPDFQHQRTEFVADKAHSALAKVDRVKMLRGQRLANGIVGRGEGEHKMKRVREISPQSLFLKRTETEWGRST